MIVPEAARSTQVGTRSRSCILIDASCIAVRTVILDTSGAEFSSSQVILTPHGARAMGHDPVLMHKVGDGR